MLLIFRALQAAGSSSTISLGAGAIADIASPQERGGYLGMFSGSESFSAGSARVMVTKLSSQCDNSVSPSVLYWEECWPEHSAFVQSSGFWSSFQRPYSGLSFSHSRKRFVASLAMDVNLPSRSGTLQFSVRCCLIATRADCYQPILRTRKTRSSTNVTASIASARPFLSPSSGSH